MFISRMNPADDRRRRIANPGFGGREALFGLILAHISRFDFSGFSALLQQRATDHRTLFLGPHLGQRFQTTTAAANKRVYSERHRNGGIGSALIAAFAAQAASAGRSGIHVVTGERARNPFL
jgi:hypothetical protein